MPKGWFSGANEHSRRLGRLWAALRQMGWGLLVFDTYRVVETEGRHRQNAFDLLTMGE